MLGCAVSVGCGGKVSTAYPHIYIGNVMHISVYSYDITLGHLGNVI